MSDIDLKDKIKCVKCGLEFVPVKYRQLQVRIDKAIKIIRYKKHDSWDKLFEETLKALEDKK